MTYVDKLKLIQKYYWKEFQQDVDLLAHLKGEHDRPSIELNREFETIPNYPPRLVKKYWLINSAAEQAIDNFLKMFQSTTETIELPTDFLDA